jgi:hypothetical protein
VNAGHVPDVLVDDTALAFASRAVRDRQLHLVAVEQNTSGDPARYRDAELAHRDLSPTLTHRPVLFLELGTAGRTACPGLLRLRGANVEGYHVLRAEGPVTPQAIAATALRLRDMCAAQPHIYFSWPEEDRGLVHGIVLLSLTPQCTYRCLRRAERDAARRPVVHLAG